MFMENVPKPDMHKLISQKAKSKWTPKDDWP